MKETPIVHRYQAGVHFQRIEFYYCETCNIIIKKLVSDFKGKEWEDLKSLKGEYSEDYQG
jgi:hypothetical protein